MKKTLQGFIKLTRINYSLFFVVISTLLGVTAADGSFDWRFLIFLPANWLSVSVGDMVKNILTAPEDALLLHNSHKNPISMGLFSPKQARMMALIVVVLSLILYIFLGTWPLIFGLTIVLVGFITSNLGISSKQRASIEVLSHSMRLAALPFMIGYFTFAQHFNQAFFWLLGFLLAVSLYGELDQLTSKNQGNAIEQRNLTTGHFNKRTVNILMLMMLVIAIFTSAFSLFIKALIPMWVAILILVLAIILSIPRMVKALKPRSSLTMMGVFRKALEGAAALGLFLQFFIPWISQLFSTSLL